MDILNMSLEEALKHYEKYISDRPISDYWQSFGDWVLTLIDLKVEELSNVDYSRN